MRTDPTLSIEWRLPPSPLTLPADACHLWRVDLKSAAAPELLATLHLDEQERAARLRFERDRERFALCRAALRTILGAYLQREPAELRFSVGQHGRPHLVDVSHLDFNVTHSGDLALIAVAARSPLGVDIEALREVPQALDLAARYFHGNEREAIGSIAPEDRSRRFLTCWTRKEAVLKSTGLGIAYGAARIDVGVDLQQREIELQVDATAHRVRVISVIPEGGYIGACAVATGITQIECLSFTMEHEKTS